MATFYFEALDRENIRRRDSLEAGNKQEALSKLRQQGMVVIKLAKRSSLQKLFRQRHGVDAQFRLNFSKQMAVMLEAGIPILEAVRVLTEDGRKGSRNCLKKLLEGLQRGYSLSESMQQADGVFSDFMVAVVRAGELSGNLPKTLMRLHDLLKKNYEARKKLEMAMVYPLFLCGLSAILVVFLLKQVIPVFAEVFAGFQAELPWSTELLLSLSDNLPEYAADFALFALACYVLWRVAFSIRRIGIRLAKLRFYVPLLGRLHLRSEQALFFATLSMLLQSGIRVNYGVELMKNMCRNLYLEFCYESMLKQLAQGHSFGACLKKERLYPPMVLSMVNAGEKTGELAHMLEYAASVCQEEADGLMEKIQILAEPLVIVVLGVVVGFIVLSTVLPVLDLMNVM